MSDRQLEEIGSYVKSHLPQWLAEIAPERRAPAGSDPVLLERMVRVEESLSHQRELMQHGFDAMEKRFEQVDKRFEEMRADTNARFEQVDKRFEDMHTSMDARFRTTNRMIVAFFALVTIVSAVVQVL